MGKGREENGLRPSPKRIRHTAEGKPQNGETGDQMSEILENKLWAAATNQRTLDTLLKYTHIYACADHCLIISTDRPEGFEEVDIGLSYELKYGGIVIYISCFFGAGSYWEL